MYRVAIICGSLRKASTNAGLLRQIVSQHDSRFAFQWIDISKFPLFNEDIQAQGLSQDIQTARTVVSKSDAILFGVPEYNYSVSSALKNAFDWLSRNDKNQYCPLQNQIGAMVSSGGGMGGGRGQDHFRQIVTVKKMELLKPSKQGEFLVKRFSGKVFDENGNLIDEGYKKRVPIFLQEFSEFIAKKKSNS